MIVTVTRDEPLGWRAEVGGAILVRQAASLAGLDRSVRDTCGDDVEYDVHTGDDELDQLLNTIRTTRRALRTIDEQVLMWTLAVLAAPRMFDMSNRDAAVVLGVSYQWVHQLRQTKLRRDRAS